MANYKIKQTSAFKNDLKTYKHDKKLKQELITVTDLLKEGSPLPEKYKDHLLHGNYKGERDCHVRPNLVLIYHINNGDLVLVRVGTHNKLGLTETINKINKLLISESTGSLETFTSIEQVISAMKNNRYNYYGFRNATDHDLEVIKSGRDYLDASHDWVDGEDTEENLDGSCAIYIDKDMDEQEIKDRYDQCLYGYWGDDIILIADNRSEWGSDDSEIILGSNGRGADVIGFVNL